MSGYADAINAAMARHVLDLRQYGMLLAQAGMDIRASEHEAWELEHIRSGYDEQLEDYPFG